MRACRKENWCGARSSRWSKAACQAEAKRIDGLVKERQRDEREAAARRAVIAEEHAAALLEGERAEARRQFYLQHPRASEYEFSSFWAKVRPSVAEVQARQVA